MLFLQGEGKKKRKENCEVDREARYLQYPVLGGVFRLVHIHPRSNHAHLLHVHCQLCKQRKMRICLAARGCMPFVRECFFNQVYRVRLLCSLDYNVDHVLGSIAFSQHGEWPSLWHGELPMSLDLAALMNIFIQILSAILRIIS